MDVEGTPARVFSAEHLAAIALETGRAKKQRMVTHLVKTYCLYEVRHVSPPEGAAQVPGRRSRLEIMASPMCRPTAGAPPGR